MGAFPRGWCFLSPVGKCARQANPIFEMGIVNITIGSCFDKQMSYALTWNKITEIVFVCFLSLSAEFRSVKIHELFTILRRRLWNNNADVKHKKKNFLANWLTQYATKFRSLNDRYDKLFVSTIKFSSQNIWCANNVWF